MADVTHRYATTTGITGDATDYTWQPLNSGNGPGGTVIATLSIGTDNLTDGDVWNFATLPAGFVITNVSIRTTDLDSDGSPALDIQLYASDGTTTTSFNAGDLTIAQTGGVGGGDQNLPAGGYADPVTVYAEVETTAATAQAGTATMVIEGYVS